MLIYVNSFKVALLKQRDSLLSYGCSLDWLATTVTLSAASPSGIGRVGFVDARQSAGPSVTQSVDQTGGRPAACGALYAYVLGLDASTAGRRVSVLHSFSDTFGYYSGATMHTDEPLTTSHGRHHDGRNFVSATDTIGEQPTAIGR